MNDAVIIQQVYPGRGYEPLIELTRQRNVDYCAAHNFDLQIVIDGVIDVPVDLGGWSKVELVRRALVAGYRYVVWLDADAVIKNLLADLRDALPAGGIGCVWHRNSMYDHWNVGVMYFRNTKGTLDFIREWQAQAPGVDQWHEQSIYNSMANDIKWACVIRTLDPIWNSTTVNAPCDNPVIMAFHGCGDAQKRLNLMREAIK
jgi:hypothetical protein